MNFIRKIGCSGEDIAEIGQPPKIDRSLPSSSASHQQRYCQPQHQHHQHHRHQQQQRQEQQHEPQQQPQPFLAPLPYQPHNHCGWISDPQGPVGEPSSNQNEKERGMLVEREHMFDKVVTPSDVGKLNRLVIPKQHAERYFPLDSSNNDKGLLLNFEDMNGKLWRFRYSYWNSSQSYVMTKGWSRFVKEKKLDAGDIVSFQRGVGATSKDRLFIDCRRRVNHSSPSHQLSSSNLSLIHPWNPLVLQSFPAKRNPNMILQPPNNNLFYNTSWDGNKLDRSRSFYFGPSVFGAHQQHVQMMQRNGFGFRVDPPPIAPSPTQPIHGKSFGKRLRLFGVNMDCSFSEEENEQDPHHGTLVPSPSSSSLFSTIPYLQLNSYGGGSECNQSSLLSPSSSSVHDFNIVAKSTASNMSLDLDI